MKRLTVTHEGRPAAGALASTLALRPTAKILPFTGKPFEPIVQPRRYGRHPKCIALLWQWRERAKSKAPTGATVEASIKNPNRQS